MIAMGIIVALSGLEQPAILAYQIIILGAMLFGLGFLAIVIYALLSEKNTSEESTNTSGQMGSTYRYCQSCKRLMKHGSKFCAFCGTNQ